MIRFQIKSGSRERKIRGEEDGVNWVKHLRGIKQGRNVILNEIFNLAKNDVCAKIENFVHMPHRICD